VISASGGKFDPSSATMIDDVAIPPPSSSDSGALAVATAAWLGCMLPKLNFVYGFVGPRSLGSYSPTGLTGGETVVAVYDTTGNCVGTFSDLSVSGFSSSPGSSWLSSITCNGVTNNGSSARFIYSSGSASWEWSQLFGLQSKSGSNVSCTIVHN
jgi:hypothetical protein